VSDGFERVAVGVVSVGGWAVHIALDKAERARTVRKEVSVTKLHADIDAREFRTIDGVKGRGGGHQNFDACVLGKVGGRRSKEGGASLLGAVGVYKSKTQRTKRESVAPSRVVMDLRGWRRMEELEAQSRICGHVVMLLC
jgi:hypothetical protein